MPTSQRHVVQLKDYGRLSSDNRERLLLIIDPQIGFLSERTAHAFEACAAAIRYYPISIITRCINGEGSPLRNLLGWDECAPESTGAEVDPRFEALPRIDKTGYSVDPLLVEPFLIGRNGIDVAGVETDACVLASALRLFDHGIDVRVRVDLCAGKLHDEAVRILRRQLGSKRVVTSHSSH